MFQELRLVQELDPETCGGATGDDTVFPAVAAWLAKSTDRYRAFERIKGRREVHRYRSLVDFLLCEVCPEERPACLAYYREEGAPLRRLRTPRELRLLESKLLLFLTISYEAWCQTRRVSWRQALSIIEQLSVAA